MNSNFKILSASAGTGKTYQLTKTYLTLLLKSGEGQYFRNLLAITFTNKAVAEMRKRILGSLQTFAHDKNAEENNPIFKEVATALNISTEKLRNKARLVLKLLLHNYAFFEITTIDGFNHKLIRTFARDLKIAQNFEVELDTDFILGLTISNVLNSVGEDPQLTKTLIDFSLEKIENDKSWDVGYNLYEIGTLIFKEDHFKHLTHLKSKTSEDFLALKSKLHLERKKAQSAIQDYAKSCLDLITSSGLKHTDFNRELFPKFLEKAVDGVNELEFERSKWMQNFGEEPLYKKSTPEASKQVIDGLIPKFASHFNTIKSAFYKHEFLLRCEKYITPLSILSEISKAFEKLKREMGFLTISEFNQLIAKELKKQPVPYIYERLGERYHHYFIDEFQDTSLLQWNNLVPLFSHALESQNDKGQPGSLFLVGDVKQSIYRWRGGEPEQFLNLILEHENPFTVVPKIEQLSKNWRSHEEIVNFNNAFFSFVANRLSNKEFSKAYEDGNRQATNHKEGGLVHISFLPKKNEVSTEESPHCQKTFDIINEIICHGYSFGDICVLVRSKKEGLQIAEHLQRYNLPIVSSEVLLLKNSKEVEFLVSFFGIVINHKSLEDTFTVLNYLSKNEASRYDFIKKHLNNFSAFLQNEYELNLHSLRSLSIIELTQKLILAFDLAKSSSIFITNFFDVVFEHENKKQGSLSSFLHYWQQNVDKLSVSLGEEKGAIEIMTVHKAKGLEFPFVIYPFADSRINDATKQNDIWFEADPQSHAGFSELLVTANRFMEHYSVEAKNAFIEESEKSELDDFNVLYVALTRAVQGLYIITIPVNQNSRSKTDSYASLLRDYLIIKNIYVEGSQEYIFGQLIQCSGAKETGEKSVTIEHKGQIFSEQDLEIVTANNFDFVTNLHDAKEFGNLVHRALAKIYTKEDVVQVVKKMIVQNEISFVDSENFETTLKQIVEHEDLRPYFKSGIEVKNEAEILLEDGSQLRPDKIIIDEGMATLIDYKTGTVSQSHQKQLDDYAEILKKMGLGIEKKLLVYINDTINIIEI